MQLIGKLKNKVDQAASKEEARELIEQAGAEIVGFGFLLELTPFNSRAKLAEITDAEFYSLVQVDEY